MRTQDVVLILLAVVVLFLLLQKVVSSFTTNDDQTFQSNFTYIDATGGIKSTVDFYLATLNGQPMMPMVNKILADAMATTLPPVQPLVPYTSESQLQTMFGDASKNGESGLTFTDRYLLRYVTVVFILLFNNAQRVLGQVTWDARGKPSFADEVLPKNQSIQDNMKIVFELIQSMYAGDSRGGVTQGAIDKINTILPTNLTKFASVQDFNTRQSSAKNVGDTDPAVLFVVKYVMVGPAYLTWVAENYYKLDPAFKCYNVPSKDATNAQMSVPTPAPAQAIVPTPAPSTPI
jgi:hypothetical protein